MQIPIVNDSIKQQEFQSSEPRYYQKSDKKRSKMKIAILSIILYINWFIFFCSCRFGNKYEEMPDLKGKTEKQAEKVLDSHHLKSR